MKNMLQKVQFSFIGFVILMIAIIGCSNDGSDNPVTPNGSSQVLGSPVSYQGNVLKVTLTDSTVVVENVSAFPVAIRVSWDGADPSGIGAGPDSFIDWWVAPGEQVIRAFNSHFSSQGWSWDSTGALVDAFDIPITQSPGGGSTVLYQGSVLSVSQADSNIVVKNISAGPVAIRISWDDADPDALGRGSDSYLDSYVLPNESVVRPINQHSTVQGWSWDSSGALVDSFNVSIR